MNILRSRADFFILFFYFDIMPNFEKCEDAKCVVCGFQYNKDKPWDKWEVTFLKTDEDDSDHILIRSCPKCNIVYRI